MRKFKRFQASVVLAIFILTTFMVGAVFAADPVTGAIFTTDSIGNVVNGNVIYEAKEDVYLNGGPDKTGKLPDGFYYIQVTEPNGKVLGTSVNNNNKSAPRTFEVRNGLFVYDPAWSAGMNQDPATGAGLIQLFWATKFKQTGNSGGEYKVWISQDSAFPQDLSKTDNFKLKYRDQWANLRIIKFNDANRNYVQDAGEPLITWTVKIQNVTDPSNPIAWDQTLVNGVWEGLVSPGTYVITEYPKVGWVNTLPTSQTITLLPKDSEEVIFGNRELGKLKVTKFYDIDGDGTKDAGESLLPGWKANVYGTNIFGEAVDMVITLADGNWEEYMDPGSYSVEEYMPEGNWYPTTDKSVSVNLGAGEFKHILFGNVYLGIDGGHTHGFWGNNNGMAIFTSDPKYLDAINELALVDSAGNRVTPFSGYAAYAEWNKDDANATNMARMLSIQLAAMQLNVTAGPNEIFDGRSFVDGNAAILIGKGCSVMLAGQDVNHKGFVTINDLIAAANEELAAHPLTLADSPYRAYQEFLKTALDKANNNNPIYVQTTPPLGPYF